VTEFELGADNVKQVARVHPNPHKLLSIYATELLRSELSFIGLVTLNTASHWRHRGTGGEAN